MSCDQSPVTRGRSAAEYPLLHGPCAARWGHGIMSEVRSSGASGTSALSALHIGGCPHATCALRQGHVCMQHAAGKSLAKLTSSHTCSRIILMPLDIRRQEPHVSPAAIDTAIEILQRLCTAMPLGTQHHNAPSPSPWTPAAVREALGPALGQSHGPALALQPPPIDPVTGEGTLFAYDLPTVRFGAESGPPEGLGGAPSEVPAVLPDRHAIVPARHCLSPAAVSGFCVRGSGRFVMAPDGALSANMSDLWGRLRCLSDQGQIAALMKQFGGREGANQGIFSPRPKAKMMDAEGQWWGQCVMNGCREAQGGS